MGGGLGASGSGGVEAGLTSVIDRAHAYLRCPGVSIILRCGPMSLFSFAAIRLRALAINFAWPVFFMRYREFAWSCMRCNDIEGINVSASRAWTGVALYPPEISRRHLFCTTDSLFSNDLVNPLTSLGACHTADPYVIAGLTTAVYTCRAHLTYIAEKIQRFSLTSQSRHISPLLLPLVLS